MESTSRTTLRRHPERGQGDVELLHRIVDEARIGFLAFQENHGPVVLPIAFARLDDDIVVHGARGGRLLQSLVDAPICFCVALVDGVVIARSQFHCSMNYRSLVVFGVGRRVADPELKARALQALVDKLTFSHGSALRAPSQSELSATEVVALSLKEASMKVRSGPPKDAAQDLGAAVWAGEVALSERPTRVVPAPGVSELLPADLQRDLSSSGLLVQEQLHGAYCLSTNPERIELDTVHGFLSEASYWARGIERDRVARSIAGSIPVGAYLDGAQVGFARMVTDRATFAWIADVFVLPEHRGRGLARAMVKLLCDLPAVQGVRRVLLGTHDAHGVYDALGFVPLEHPERYMVLART